MQILVVKIIERLMFAAAKSKIVEVWTWPTPTPPRKGITAKEKFPSSEGLGVGFQLL